MTKKIYHEQSITAAVMVAGAGIAGMQAALDLADAGFKVYLVESGSLDWQQSAKGGTTIRCFLCSLSSKLLAVQVHSTIELMEHASVEAINGIAGNFSVHVDKTAAASARKKGGKTEKDSSRHRYIVSVGAIIFAPGFNSLTAPARDEFKTELRKMAKKHGFSVPVKKTGRETLLHPHATSKPGIFVAGNSSASEIKDFIVEGSSAAALSAELLASRRGALAPEKQYPAEMRIAGEEPRIGVFVCKHIRAVEKAAAGMVGSARKLNSVVLAEEIQHMCSPDALQQIKSAIAAHGLNRVVAVSCNPHAHEPLFQNALAEAGLNRYLFEITDAGKIQSKEKSAAAAIRMAVTRTQLLEPLRENSTAVAQRGLVIGNGISAMTAALSLANQGFEVYLVEPETESQSPDSKPLRKSVSAAIKKLKRALEKQLFSHRKIQTFIDARITECAGHPGCYTTSVSVNGAKKVLKHGTIIIEPDQGQEDLAVLLKIPVTADGSYLRPDALLPLDLACGGMFCCGVEESAGDISGSIAQGLAAAARAATILAKKDLLLSSVISVVDQERCVACLACVRDCPYSAPAISEGGVAFIEPVECRGCGICVSVCPRKAIELKHYTDEQILAELGVFADARSCMEIP